MHAVLDPDQENGGKQFIRQGHCYAHAVLD